VTRFRLRLLGVFVVLVIGHRAQAAGPSKPDMERLATEKSCYLCHSARPARKGSDSVLPYAPSWVEVAVKYRGQQGAEDRLAAIVMAGSDPRSRHWEGKVSDAGMLPNTPEVNEVEARQLVRWILSFPSR